MDYLKFFLAAGLLLCGSCAAETPVLPADSLQIAGRKITVELALNDTDRTRGLSDRQDLPDDRGMLFIFPRPARRGFWMYHCLFDIDLAYIAPDGTVLETMTMLAEPYDTPRERLRSYPSQSSDVQYVLEMRGGWFVRYGLQPGDRLDVTRFTTDK